jgi:AcrR family transcriptional regulator
MNNASSHPSNKVSKNTSKKPVKSLSELKPRANPIQARSEKTRAEIIKAAIKIIDEQGIQALTTRRIATETNIAIASVYRYFPNKEAILYAIIGDWYERIVQLYEKYDAIDTTDMTWQAFFHLLDYDSFFTAPEFAAGYRYWSVIANTQAVPELHELDQRHEDRIVNYIATFLKRFGSTWPMEDLTNLARLYFHTSDAAYMLSLSQPDALAQKTIRLYNTQHTALFEKCFNEKMPSYS